MTQGCFRSSDARPGDECADARVAMVAHQIEARGIGDAAVLEAMRRVPRHLFVPPEWRSHAHEDGPLPIGHDQTISQPYIVAAMTELLGVGAGDVVLEVGTGSGYQAAVLAALGIEVFTVERIGDLLRTARKRFRTLGLHVRSKHDDGRIGWPEEAPFDAIIVTAAGPALVDALVAQLAPGGTLVAPVGGSGGQSLLRLRKREDGSIEQADLGPVIFVPLLSGMTDR